MKKVMEKCHVDGEHEDRNGHMIFVPSSSIIYSFNITLIFIVQM